MKIQIAATSAEIDACYPVRHELRPHLRADAFVQIVRDMQRDGYVDDLVTLSSERSKGYGKALLAWFADRARTNGCAHLDLDSGMQRKDAHRFYERNGLPISGYHFSVELERRVPWEAFES